MSYTPGPWKILDDYDQGIRPCHPAKGCSFGYAPIAKIVGDKRTTNGEINRANARLITAAPEMLELLRTFVGWYSNKETDNFHKVMPFKNQPPEIQDAMKLIKKITGESYV
ncbi:hypothetical protein UFOVP626_52 [uncultured Caudovirales phage]|uniref:Uncharacterized protein n=1 Tax=uncultured Caudovirales phage TaxID=2100421 RepID=A0A6J7XQ56_9CAUD|nr:hypothetical protein UFOVP626_52 [uncultured Caudovirales phage]CAB4173326.1 hypothetical protein UFOVP951_47 [uncultured Caudovirales phage]CAB4184857.1 hypothetical protein UFOVP1115_44 [uncultured Caudovirales phage]CAB4204343.1 hypothetical protein UFOVP1390_58 [uncultured Caudovirales phage]CAB5238445.1 hypothetical protein UFOVP1567_43 [uncultured Caudovirales phage]